MQLRAAYRVTTFVPPEHLDRVLDAILVEVPLTYGPYDKSAWWSGTGTEQFEPRAGAQPTVGEVGRVERLPTVRLEFIIPHDDDLRGRALNALLDAHPWQEPAVFIDPTTITVSNPE
jgi:hypothetical protein